MGWIVGWIEENNHPYFFVLNLNSRDPHLEIMNLVQYQDAYPEKHPFGIWIFLREEISWKFRICE